MRGRRKARAKGTWFPPLGSTFDDGEGNAYAAAQEIGEFGINPNSALGPNFENQVGGECFALLPDQTPQISAHDADFTLRDYVEGQEYLLDSIVGTLDVFCKGGPESQPGDNIVWPYVCVTAGIFVADADIEGGEVSPDVEDSQLDPNNADNLAAPWIWRRQWPLGNPRQSSSYGTTGSTTNYLATDGKGRAVETKSKRRIRRNQRLWLVLSGYGFNLGGSIAVTGAANLQPRIHFRADLRIIGQMRKAHNQSAF